MKLAILTRLAGYNMGTTLQAYAISKFVEQIGYPNIVINYNEYAGHWKWKIKPMINSALLSLMKIFPRFSNVAFPKKFQQLTRSYEQMNNFHQFEKDYIPLTKRKYNSIKTLSKDFKSLDACICGSDQIWSPYFFDPVFFLTFITSPQTKKIAYAPSIGVTDETMISEKQRQLMQNITYISCREREGAQIIKKITQRETPVVLDPTLMIAPQEWEQLASKSNVGKNQKYILTYFLHTDYYTNSLPHSYIKKLKQKTGLPVYNISLFNLVNDIQADKQFNTIGPLEFLSLVKHAEWICTNSFHCCIFSFIFKRHFFVFERFMKNSTNNANQNSRISNLMKLFNLAEAITDPDSIPQINLLYNFDKGFQNLEIEKEKSIAYLKTALS